MVKPVVVRTCVGCRQRAAKAELLRVVAGTDAEGHLTVVVDPRGTAPGRGAHLHLTTGCLALAERRRAFPRALRVPGAMSTDTLRRYLTERDPTQNWSTSS